MLAERAEMQLHDIDIDVNDVSSVRIHRAAIVVPWQYAFLGPYPKMSNRAGCGAVPAVVLRIPDS